MRRAVSSCSCSRRPRRHSCPIRPATAPDRRRPTPITPTHVDRGPCRRYDLTPARRSSAAPRQASRRPIAVDRVRDRGRLDRLDARPSTALLEPTMQQYRTSLPDATLPRGRGRSTARFGYQLVGLGTIDAADTDTLIAQPRTASDRAQGRRRRTSDQRASRQAARRRDQPPHAYPPRLVPAVGSDPPAVRDARGAAAHRAVPARRGLLRRDGQDLSRPARQSSTRTCARRSRSTRSTASARSRSHVHRAPSGAKAVATTARPAHSTSCRSPTARSAAIFKHERCFIGLRYLCSGDDFSRARYQADIKTVASRCSTPAIRASAFDASDPSSTIDRTTRR